MKNRFMEDHENGDFNQFGTNIDFGDENVDEGTEFTAVKPWMG